MIGPGEQPREDQKVAREMVERDARNVARAFAQLDCPVEVVSDIPPPDGNDGDGTLINFTIGTRDHLNKAEAKASAELWR